MQCGHLKPRWRSTPPAISSAANGLWQWGQLASDVVSDGHRRPSLHRSEPDLSGRPAGIRSLRATPRSLAARSEYEPSWPRRRGVRRHVRARSSSAWARSSFARAASSASRLRTARDRDHGVRRRPHLGRALQPGGHLRLFLVTRRIVTVARARLLGRRSSPAASLGALALRARLPERGRTWTPACRSVNATIGTGSGVVLEAIMTFSPGLGGLRDRRRSGGSAFKSIAGLAIGLTITIGILAAGPLTGAAVNPARALGPELVATSGTTSGSTSSGPPSAPRSPALALQTGSTCAPAAMPVRRASAPTSRGVRDSDRADAGRLEGRVEDLGALALGRGAVGVDEKLLVIVVGASAASVPGSMWISPPVGTSGAPGVAAVDDPRRELTAEDPTGRCRSGARPAPLAAGLVPPDVRAGVREAGRGRSARRRDEVHRRARGGASSTRARRDRMTRKAYASEPS